MPAVHSDLVHNRVLGLFYMNIGRNFLTDIPLYSSCPPYFFLATAVC